MHVKTGSRFCVEAKARDPVSQARQMAAVEGADGPNFGIINKLHKALGKHAEHPRVVFIELALPVAPREDTIEGIIKAITAEIRAKEAKLSVRGQPALPAYLFITNHPFHQRIDGLATGPAVLALGFKITDFGHGFTFRRFSEYVAAQERHGPMVELMKSVAEHQEIPSTFNGEIPAFAFSDDGDPPPLQIGSTYLIPDADS